MIRSTWWASAGSLAGAVLLLWTVTADAGAHQRLRGDPEAEQLLRRATEAARGTAFQGVQFIVTWNGGSATPSIVNIAHAPGQGTRLEVQRTTAAQGGVIDPRYPTSASGLTGYTEKMLDLLVRNHSVVEVGDSTACSRRARVVEARRPDGSVAGRFWIDRRSGLMLRREMIDQAGRTVSSTAFTDLRVARPHVNWGAATTVAAPWGTRLGGDQLAVLRSQGWAIPAVLPGNLTLYEARRDDSASVVHLGYTDGLSVVSVFVQRGVLDERRIGGFRKVSQKGHTVYLRNTVQQRIVWGSRGYVYAVVADAPPSTVDAAVAALPHGQVGFWSRLGRGFGRLVSWVTPFQ